MSQQKPKQTFLKKGTRQFLSNATVRSLSQKPKLVQYSQDIVQTFNSPFIHGNAKNDVKNDKNEAIMINVKPKNNLSKQKSKQSSNQIKKNFKRNNSSLQNNKNHSNSNSLEQNIQVSIKTNEKTFTSKNIPKKPTLLTDYLGSNTKVGSQKMNSVTNNNLVSKHPSAPVVQSQVQQLKMQALEDDSDDQKYGFQNKQQNSDDENQFIQNKKENYVREPSKRFQQQELKNASAYEKKKPNLLLQQALQYKQKQIFNQPTKIQQQNQVQFKSDSEGDEKQTKNHFKSKNVKINHNNRFQQQKDQSQNQSSSNEEQVVNRKATVKMVNKPQSKVTQMFNRNSDKKTISQAGQEHIQIPLIKNKKLTIEDIPKQLIEEIVQKYFKQAKQKYQKKQQNLIDQVKIVQKKQQSVNQQEKTFQKKLKQFQKQMQEKNKEFQNKIKSEQNKITRQKMYLKDQQTTGKIDWKTKNQVQQLKQQLEEEKNDKKRIQVKLKGELDRLKVRYNEEIQSKRLLENRIKQYQLKDLKQRQTKFKEQKIQKMQINQKKKTFWDDSPKLSYLEKFYNKGFSLNQLSVDEYYYQNNEFYQYYKQKGQTDVLQAQQVQGNKIKRTYQNGKIQIESIQKFVKQVFPWGFTIVHYINGDIKQIIQLQNKQDSNNPRRLQIYYAKNNQIIEYSISDGKRIHYFLSQDQIQLNDQLIQLKQVYNGKQLQRINQGTSIVLQRNGKGKFVEIYV